MQSPTLFYTSLTFLIFFVYVGYIPWFKPKEYLQLKHNMRQSNDYRYPFSLRGLNYKIFARFPQLDLWGARLVSLMCVISCIIGIAAAIWSPYVGS